MTPEDNARIDSLCDVERENEAVPMFLPAFSFDSRSHAAAESNIFSPFDLQNGEVCSCLRVCEAQLVLVHGRLSDMIPSRSRSTSPLLMNP